MVTPIPALGGSKQRPVRERRAWPRSPRQIRVLLLAEDCALDEPYGGCIVDTSRGGVRLRIPGESFPVGTLILPRTWRLLKEAIDILLEASPAGIDLAEIREHMASLPGIREVHDLHVWTITSGLPVFSAHVVVDPAVI